MTNILSATIAGLLSLHSVFVADALSADSNPFAEIIAPTVQKHCVKCHGANADELAGDLNLLTLQNRDLDEAPELIRSLIDMLDLEEMPPEGEPPLDPKLRQQMISELRRILHASIASQKTFPHAPVRRMNRFQYNNAVVDLFDLQCIVFTLPERMMREHNGYFKPHTGKMADVVTVGSRPLGKSQMIERRLAGVAAFPQDLRAEHGYDNQADHLSLSPLLMEAFLKLGQSVTESPDFGPKNVGLWKSFFELPVTNVDPKTEVRRRLEQFLTRAFRRRVEPALLDRYASFVNRQLDSGIPFTEAMKSVAAATISSPKFLYLYDKSGVGETT